MVKTCIVCKKQPVPYDSSRSFHKFPDNSDLKKKWMDAIGVSAITKSSALCNDHFDESAFHDTDGYTTRRRIIATAVPRNIKNNQPFTIIVRESDLNALRNVIQLEHTYALSTGSPNNTDTVEKPLEISDSEKLISTESAVNTQQSCKSTVNTQQSCKSTINIQKSWERKADIVDTSVSRKRVKIRFQTEWFSRNDFTTEQAWARFLRFLRQVKLEREASSQSRRRAQSKLKSFKEVVKNLKEKQHSEF